MLLWTLLYTYIVKSLLSFVYKPRSKIMGSYDNSMLNSLKNCHTIFHSSHRMLCSHQQCTKAPVYLYARQCLFSVFMISHFIGCQVSHCEVDLHFPICDAEHLSCGYWPFIHLLWRNVYSNPLPNNWVYIPNLVFVVEF